MAFNVQAGVPWGQFMAQQTSLSELPLQLQRLKAAELDNRMSQMKMDIYNKKEQTDKLTSSMLSESVTAEGVFSPELIERSLAKYSSDPNISEAIPIMTEIMEGAQKRKDKRIATAATQQFIGDVESGAPIEQSIMKYLMDIGDIKGVFGVLDKLDDDNYKALSSLGKRAQDLAHAENIPFKQAWEKMIQMEQQKKNKSSIKNPQSITGPVISNVSSILQEQDWFQMLEGDDKEVAANAVARAITDGASKLRNEGINITPQDLMQEVFSAAEDSKIDDWGFNSFDVSKFNSKVNGILRGYMGGNLLESNPIQNKEFNGEDWLKSMGAL